MTNRMVFMMKTRLINWIVSLPLLVIFFLTGTDKLRHPDLFKNKLMESPILSSAASWLMWIVPAVELSVVLLLLFNRSRRIGFYISLMLFALFTLYIIALSSFTYYIPCSCGGFLDQLSVSKHILLNIGLGMLSAVGIIIEKRQLKVKNYNYVHA